MDWEYLKQNPAQGVRFPPRQPKPRTFLSTTEQLNQLLAKLSEPAFTLSLLLIGTGLRVGEAIGLCWGDIDFRDRKLTVARDIWHGKINSPKYAASERVVPLGPVLAEHLMNKAKGPEQWVFEGNSGKPLDPRYLARRLLYPVLDELEIPRFSWHRLRKLHSTYLADLGVAPRVLQAQLGHADAALTLNVYAQVLPESQRKAVEALEGLLFRNVPKPGSEGRVQ